MRKGRLKGGAMVYAIFVAVVIALLSFMMINLSFLNHSFFMQNEASVRLIQNSTSGIHYLLASDEKELNKIIEINPYTSDTIQVEKQSWGIYELLKSKAYKGNKKHQKIAFSATQLDTTKQIGLYLSKENYTLKVSGETKLYGQLYIPNSKIERAYIEGKNYMGNKLSYGPVFNSKNSIPTIDLPDVSIEDKDSVVEWSLFDEYAFQHSFKNPNPLVFYSDSLIKIDSIQLKGFIKIVSEEGIKVSNHSQLNDVILIAPYVHIYDDVKGNCQVFARDSIRIDKETHLEYPSAIVLQSKSAVKSYKGIEIKGNSSLIGDVICHAASDLKSLVCLHVSKGSSVQGQLYSTHYASIRGEVYGSVTCRNIILDTRTSSYNNHLLDAVIDPRKLSKSYCGIAIHSNVNPKNSIVKWLH